ncbi:MAG: acyltransferase [Rhodospirillaceae bacterium]
MPLPSDPLSPPGQRIAAIDELKGLAIFLVLVFHCTCTLQLANYSLGHSGVDIFLALSGFGLGRGLRSESAGRFLIRRLALILPRYWLALVLVILGNGWVLGQWDSLRSIGFHVFILHGFDAESFYAINISWWFMGMIVPLYGVAALMRPWLASGRADRVIAAGLGLTAIGYSLLLALVSDGIARHFGTSVPEFILGLAAGCGLRLGWAGLTLATPLLGGAVLVFVLYCGTVAPGLLESPDPIFGFAWAFGYLLLTGGPWTAMVWLRRLAAGLGAMSFEVYLYHQPIVTDYNRQVWRWLSGGADPGAAEMVVGMVVGFALVVGVFTALRVVGRRRSG